MTQSPKPGHQAEALGQRDESGRRHVAANRMAPAQQRFGGGDLAAGSFDLGLEHQHQLVVFERMTEVAQQLHVLGQVAFHRRVVEREPAAAGPLGGLHRQVAARGQALAVAVLRVLGHADRAAQHDLPRAEPEGLADRVDHRPAQLLQRQEGRLLGQHDHELVGALARQQGAVGHQGAQPLPHLLEELVTHRMAKAHVDRLEPVQIHRHHGQSLAVDAAGRQFLAQPGFQRRPVGQPGQGIDGLARAAQAVHLLALSAQLAQRHDQVTAERGQHQHRRPAAQRQRSARCAVAPRQSEQPASHGHGRAAPPQERQPRPRQWQVQRLEAQCHAQPGQKHPAGVQVHPVAGQRLQRRGQGQRRQQGDAQAQRVPPVVPCRPAGYAAPMQRDRGEAHGHRQHPGGVGTGLPGQRLPADPPQGREADGRGQHADLGAARRPQRAALVRHRRAQPEHGHAKGQCQRQAPRRSRQEEFRVHGQPADSSWVRAPCGGAPPARRPICDRTSRTRCRGGGLPPLVTLLPWPAPPLPPH
jgi:hypothetical protein